MRKTHWHVSSGRVLNREESEIMGGGDDSGETSIAQLD
jgi:hypothetical protein